MYNVNDTAYRLSLKTPVYCEILINKFTILCMYLEEHNTDKYVIMNICKNKSNVCCIVMMT